MRRTICILLALVFGAIAPLAADPDKVSFTSDAARNQTKKTKAARSGEVTPAEEQQAMQLVEEHHPELVALLNHLKTKRTKEYARAVRELSRTNQRLAQFHERDPRRYQLELKVWQVQSRIQLLAARLTMSASGDLENKLRSSLAEYHDLRRKILEYNRKQLSEKLDRLDAQIQQAEKNRDNSIEAQFKALVDGKQRGDTKRPRKNQPPGAKSAPAPKSGKSKPPAKKPNS